MAEWFSNYLKDSEDYSYDLVNSGGRRDVEPNWAERLMGYTLYHGYWDLLGGKSHRYWQNHQPSAVTRTDGGKESQKMPNRRNDGKKPAWYGPGKNQYKQWNSKGKVIPWSRLTSEQKNGLYVYRSGYGKKGFSKVQSKNPRQRARGAMTVRSRGGRSGFVSSYRAPTNYATVNRGGGAYLSRNIRTMRGMGKVMRYKAFVGTLIFKTTGATELKINSADTGGQIYFNPAAPNYFGDTPFSIQVRLFEHYRWVSLCLELSTRLPTTDTTGVIWGASDDCGYFKKVGVASATTNVSKTILLQMSRSGTFNAWTPRVCVALPLNRKWMYTAGPDQPGLIYNFADPIASQRETYGGTLAVLLEGTTPVADLTVANVWLDQKVLVRKIGAAQTTALTSEIKVSLDKKAKYDKAMMLVNDDNFDVDRCLADLKLVDDTVRLGEEDDEKDWRWLKKYGTSIKDRTERPSTPTPSVKSDKSVKPKSNSLK